jgi:GDP-mannose 6-dehydrogenase
VYSGLDRLVVSLKSYFAKGDNQVIGVDLNHTKVELINGGSSPIVEAGMNDLAAQTAASGKLRATTGTTKAINSSDISLVCVGTPSKSNGSLDLTYIVTTASRTEPTK